MPRIDHGVVAIRAKDPAGDVVEQFFERPLRPRLAYTAGEQVITGDGRLGLGQA
jgi:hypothetical protein